MVISMTKPTRKLYSLLKVVFVCFLLLQAGCMTTSIDRFTYPSGLRFDEGGQVQEKLMSTGVTKQKYTPLWFLRWENAGKYSVSGRKTWWRETADGKRYRIRGQRLLQRRPIVFYPMTETNGWLGIDTSPYSVLIPIINDVVGQGTYMPFYPEFDVQDEVEIQFFGHRGRQRLSEDEEMKFYDLLLFDGNRRLLYRTFEPGEQYYEYDALAETIEPVTLARVRYIKSNYKDMYRIPIGAQYLYWDRETLRPDFQYFRPWDPVKDAAPEWRKPNASITGSSQ